MANINKQHFLLAGSCAVVLSVFSRSSVGKIGEGIRGVNEIGILIKVLFCANTPNFIQIGGRAYPVRHYPIAIRLRTREEYAILCIALNPQSGDFSGAILEVPFKALLHLGLLPESNREGTREVNLNNCTIQQAHRHEDNALVYV